MSQPPPWNPYGQQEPDQYQGQPPAYQGQARHPHYGQQSGQPAFTPDPPYGLPPRQPQYQGQPHYPPPPYGQGPVNNPQGQPPYGQQPYPPPGHRRHSSQQAPRKRRRAFRWALASIAAIVLLAAYVLLTSLKNGSTPAHSALWKQGYQTGEQIYQQTVTALAPAPPKNPDDVDLVQYCDSSELGINSPTDASGQWQAGYEYGCYGGTG